MDKKLLKEKIKQVEENIKACDKNIQTAKDHKEEGEIILKALKEALNRKV